MVVENGDDLAGKLMNARAFCPNCGAVLTFGDAANLARNNGVSEDAVMCSNCRRVYNVNLAPGKMTLLNEIKKYNFSDNDAKIDYSDFQKRVSRDKKIIIGAAAVVALLIVFFAVAIPSLSNSDDVFGYDFTAYNDISFSSGIELVISDAFEDSNGWYSIYGKIKPRSTDTSGFYAMSNFYDDDGYLVGSDLEYLDENSAENLICTFDTYYYDVDNVDIAIVDSDDNIVARHTYYV